MFFWPEASGWDRFNEAGADCPGIPALRMPCVAHVLLVGFNEAGADCPGIPGADWDYDCPRFQASMRPGQTAPVFLARGERRRRMTRYASMRPGQTAPVFPFRRWKAFRRRHGFNEAGADCPGIPALPQSRVDAQEGASMRPGQTAPVFQEMIRKNIRAWMTLQ